MAWTQADIDKLESAIASGALSVSYGGPPAQTITYRSMADMLTALAMMRSRVSGVLSYRLASTSKGFSGPIFTAPTPAAAAGDSVRVVQYTATGSEGTSFMVPIGGIPIEGNYSVMWSPQGVQNIPLPDFPQNPGDRTPSSFRVTTAVQLAAGEKLHFWIAKV